MTSTAAVRPRILYIAPDIVLDLPRALSAHFTGDYVTIWLRGRDAEAKADRALVESSFGNFCFRPMLPSRLPPGLKQLHELWFFVREGLSGSRRDGGYDAIVCYSPYRTAMAALFLGRIIGRPVVVEFPQDPARIYKFAGGRLARLKHFLSPRLARWVAGRADCSVVLFPAQIDALLPTEPARAHVVHPFTRLSAVPADRPKERTIVLLGHPLHLKGADLLLTAFRSLSPEFPEYTLKIAGSSTTPSDLEAAAAGFPVQFMGRLGHAAALDLIAAAAIFVLPSRTEGVPRVLIEAMAAGACIIASDVGGIPYLVRDGETGLVFPSGDAAALETRLRRVLKNPAFAGRLAAAGQHRARAEFSEAVVADMWHAAVTFATTHPRP